MIRELFLLLLLSFSTESIVFQAIGVRGTLLCGDAPTPGIRIKLWDNDMGELVDSPKQSSFTDFDGKFEFDDWTPLNDEVDPVIRIAHDCNDGVKKGQRLFKFKIPRSYVYKGKEVPKEKARDALSLWYFNIGTMNLEFKPFNEERFYEGGIDKRSIIVPYAHKLHRARRHKVEATTTPAISLEDSSEVDPCDSGLCTFSGDRKRRELEETVKDASDEIAKKEESQEEEGCASEGACPIHLTRKRKDLREGREVVVSVDDRSDEVLKKGANTTMASKSVKLADLDSSPEDRIEPW